MTDTDLRDPVAVVREADALADAYALGVDHGPEDRDPDPDSYAYFTDGAMYANKVAPRLRAMSGYADAGYGTYRAPRPVVVLPTGDADDSPAVGEYHDTPDPVLNVVLDAYRRGWHDAHRDPDERERAADLSLA